MSDFNAGDGNLVVEVIIGSGSKKTLRACKVGGGARGRKAVVFASEVKGSVGKSVADLGLLVLKCLQSLLGWIGEA